jgi:hypothetical protein
MPVTSMKRLLFAVVLFSAASAMLPAYDVVPLPSAKWKETGAGLWRELELPFKAKVNSVEVIDGVLYVCTWDQGILIGRDEGRSWGQMSIGNAAIRSLTGSAGAIYAGAKGGMAYSPDGGKSWGTQAFLKGMTIYSIAASGERLILGTDAGLYFTDDEGVTVQKATGGPSGIVFSVYRGSTCLWAAAFKDDKDTALYTSGDNGATWMIRSGFPMTKGGPEVKVVPYDINVNGSAISICAGFAVFSSSDGGESWKKTEKEDQPYFTTALGSGAFLFTDKRNAVHYITPGAQEKTVPDFLPGVKGEWFYLGTPVSELIPEGGTVPDKDWTVEEVSALIHAVAFTPPSCKPVRPATEDSIESLCSDGTILYVATGAGRIFRYPLYVLSGKSPAMPEAEQLLAGKIGASLQKQDLAAAGSAITELVQKNDWNPYALFYRGYLRATQKDGTGALSDFSQLLVLQPAFADGYLYRGQVYQAFTRHVAAIPDFTRVIALKSPQAAQAMAYRGVSYAAIGNKVNAREDLEAAVKAGVKEAQAYIDKYLK